MSMAAVSREFSGDSWDQLSTSTRPGSVSHHVAPAKSIPDDWENDEDEDEAEVDNQKIWEHANTRAPMPELVLSSSNSTSLVASPPAVILQAPMRILKRPTASLNSGSNLTPQANVETLAEREVRYQAARERIFGGEEGGDKKISGKGNVTAKRGARGSQDGDLQGQVSVVNVVRNPLGPTDSSRGDGSEQTSKGFKSRAGKGPAASMQGPV